MRWYVNASGETVGPVADEVVAGWVREGRLGVDTQLRGEADVTWVPLACSPFAPRPTMLQMVPFGGWTCRHCGAVGSGYHVTRITTQGWIVFVLLLVFCFIACWIPLLTMREQQTRCLRCGTMA